MCASLWGVAAALVSALSASATGLSGLSVEGFVAPLRRLCFCPPAADAEGAASTASLAAGVGRAASAASPIAGAERVVPAASLAAVEDAVSAVLSAESVDAC